MPYSIYQPTWARISFKLGTDNYITLGNTIQRNPLATTGVGTEVGSLNGSTRTVALNTWPAGVSAQISELNGNAVSPVSGEGSLYQTDAVTFRTASAPVAPEGFTIVGTFADGETFNETADEDGYINGSDVIGVVDYNTGVVELHFGTPTTDPVGTGVVNLSSVGVPGVTNVRLRPARADTLRYNAVSYSYIPLSPDILGLNPVRLPSDGRVPVFRKGTVAVVHHTGETTPAVVSNGQTVNLGRVRLSRVQVIGANGLTITGGYTADLDAGTVTFTSVSGYSQPVKIRHRIEDAALVVDAQISGLIRLGRPLTHDYPAGSKISSALLIGDMFSRVSVFFDQATWGNVWSDDLSGSAASATFDRINYPPETENIGAVTERWALVFTGSTAFNIIGEHLGLIGSGNTASDVSPLNPATGTPYFTLDHLGFGTGWSAGNAIRFNTVGAISPLWIARVVKQGVPTVLDDSATILVRGDVDTP